MAGTTTISKAIFVAEEVGVDKTAASLSKLVGQAGQAGAATSAFSKQAKAALDQFAKARDEAAKSASVSMGPFPKEFTKVQEQNTRAIRTVAKEIESLTARLDPAHKAAVLFAQDQSRINALADAGAISMEKHGQLIALSAERYKQMGVGAKSANDNIKLTAQQMQGLGYQINDVATMLAMGASPFQVMASQAGQVVQVLQEGGGLKSSLAAIASSIAGFARAIPGAGYAVAGLAAGVGALWYATSGPDARKAEESVKSFEDAVKRLEGGWRGAGEAAKRHFEEASQSAARNPANALLDTQAQLKKLRDDYKATVRDLNSADNLPEQILRARSGGMSDAQREIRDLYTQLLASKIPAQEMADAMTRIRLDPNADDYARVFADAIRQGIAPAIELEQRIAAIVDTTAKLGGKGGRVTTSPNEANPFDLRDRFGGVTEMAGRLDPAAMDDVRQKLLDQQEEMKKAAKEVDEYAEAMKGLRASLSETVESLQLQVDMFGQSEGAIAAAEMRLDAMRQAQEAATAAGRDSVDPAILADIEARSAEYGRLTDQLKATADAQREQAKATEEAKRQQERVREFESDLQFDISQAGLSDVEKEVGETLRQLKLDYGSLDGERIAGLVRYRDEVERADQAMLDARDTAQDFVETLVSGLTSGKGVLDSLVGALAGFSTKMASAGLEKLLGGALGGSAANDNRAGGFSGLLGAVTGLTQAIAKPPTATQVFGGSGGTGFGATFAAPTIAVQRGGALPAISQQSAQLASSVTKQVSSNLLSSILGAGKSQSHVTGLNTQFASALTNMLEAAPAAVRSAVTINSGFRSVARQAELFEGALAKYGSVAAARKMVAPPGKSQHNFGNAADLGYGNAAARQWVHANAGDYGLKFPMSYENWHIELAGARGGKGATSSSTPAAAALREAVKQGTTDYARSVSSGGAPSILGGFSSAAQQAFAGGFDGFSTNSASWRPGAPAIPGTSRAAGGGGIGSSMTGMLQSPLVQGGLNALGAAAAGYQSGSPIGGGLNGALSGFMVGGPVGAVVGGIAGLVGGMAGKSKQKKEAEKAKRDAENQKALEASKAWVANLPQFADLIDTVTRNQRGSIGGTMKELNASIEQFAQLAAETKNATAMSQVEGVRKQIADYGELLKSLFRDTMDPVLADVAAGYGLDTAFTKARDGVVKTADSYRGFIADVREAYSYDTTKLDTLKADHDKAVAEIEAAKNSTLSALSAQNLKAIQAANDDTSRSAGGIDSRLNQQRAASGMSKLTEDQEAEYLRQIEEAGVKRDEAVAAYEAQIAEVKGKYDDAVNRAILAAREGLLRLVSGDVREQSAVEQALAEARGAAAGLDLALKDLGMSAEEASAAIETAIGKRRDLLARDFTEGLTDQIADLDGKGYLADLRELTKSIETMMADANLLNVDTSLVDTFFTKQAQAIVDGSELTGEAFDELIRLFPNLTDKVHAFADAVEEAGRSAAEVAARMQSANDRYFTATTDTSTLSGAMSAFNRRRMVEVQAESALGGGAMLQLEAALAAEKVNLIQGLLRSAYETERQEIEETISRLQSLSDEWGDLRKSLLLDDALSPLSQKDQFLEAQKQFRELSAKAAAGDEDAQQKLAGISSSYLEEAKAYYASSEDYYAAFNEVQGVLANSESLAQQQLNAAKSQLDIAKAQLDAMTGVKDSIGTLQAALVEAMASAAKFAPAMGGAPAAGTTAPATTGGLPGGSYNVSTQSSAYLANNPDVAAAIAAGETFGLPAGTSANVIAAAHFGLHGQTEGRGWQRGGLIPGFAKGGMIGNGQWNRDSVVARYAGGGEIALAGGEMVVSAPRVTPQTYPVLDHINRTGRVPANEGVRLDRVEQLLRTLIATTGGGLQRVAETGEQGNRSAEQMALASRRTSSNKQAA